MSILDNPAPKRLHVLKQLKTLLATIKPENGYVTDIQGRVTIGVSEFGDETPVPMLSILESPNPDYGDFAGEGNGFRKDEWTLLVQGWIENDFINPTMPAYYLAADVEKCLSQTYSRNRFGQPISKFWHNLAEMVNSVRVAPAVVRPPEGGSTKAWFYLPLRINLTVDTADPYNLGA